MTTRRAVTLEDIPNLEPHCGSWIVIRKSDNRVIGEFFSANSLLKFNAERVTIQTTAQHLSNLTC